MRQSIAFSVLLLAASQALAAGDSRQDEREGFDVTHATLSLKDESGGRVVEEREVGFTDLWVIERRSRTRLGSYRADVRLPPREGAWGLFVPNHSGRIELFWDGRFLKDSAAASDGSTAVVGGPLLARLPEGARVDGSNELRMEFVSPRGYLGIVRAPRVAPLAELEAAYLRKRVTLIYLPLGFGFLSLFVGLAFYAVYSRDPSADGAGWLTLGLLAASTSVIGMYVPTSDAVAVIVERVRPMLFHLSFVFFLLAVSRITGRPGTIGRRLVFAVTLTFMGWISLTEQVNVYRVAALWIPFSYAIGIYLLIEVIRLSRSERRRRPMLLPLMLIPVLVVHDVLGLQDGGTFWADQALSLYNPPLLAAGLMFLFTARAREQISELTTLNLELEQRVTEKHKQLEENFSQLAALERHGATLAERERMVRDMHDGLGSQLTSTLAMVESRAYSPEEVENALRDVLDDLRMMVHSMDSEVTTLVDLLALVRERVEPRLKRQGMSFRWQVNPGNCDQPLPPETSRHVLRIVQEALANVVRHAEASEIRIGTAQDGECQVLSIEDDGVGIGEANPPSPRSGRGLNNMRERAELIGAQLSVNSPAHGGTRIILRLPMGAADHE